MLIKECYRISIVLAFSYGRAKTIRIRNVSMRISFFESGEKISDFKNIWMRMQGAKVNKPCADRGLSESSEKGKLPQTSQMSRLLLRCPTTFILRYNTVTINNRSEIQIKIPGGHVLSMVRSFRGENNLEQCLDIAW